jgi:serine protease Do
MWQTAARTLGCVACLVVLAGKLPAQERPGPRPELERFDYKAGSATLRVFGPVARQARKHVVQFEDAGKALALGAIISESGLALSKASELKHRNLTAKLADGTKVAASLVVADEDNDVGLVQLEAADLSPISWVAASPAVGRWTITPGLDTSPEAVGIVSVPSRKIQHKRAFVGVHLDFRADHARILQLMPGMGAADAGLQPGDVVLGLNGSPVDTSEDLAQKLRAYREGQFVALRIQRNDGHFEVSVAMKIPPPDPEQRRFDREGRMNRMGSELSERAEGFDEAIQHDTVLQSWQCGGPLLNLDGEVIGLNIARAGRVATYALPTALLEPIIQQLRAAATHHTKAVTPTPIKIGE